MWSCHGRYVRWCRRSRVACYDRIFLWPCHRSSCRLCLLALPCPRLAGADVQDRTGDLVLTKDALCQLSYIGKLLLSRSVVARREPSARHRVATADHRVKTNLERETGIEPATNSLEGCDSTTEL